MTCCKSVFLILLLTLAFGAKAQGVKDTLNTAKQLKSKGKIHAALRILKPYYHNHPNDLNTQWVLAQTEYWAKHFRKSIALYEQALRANPKNYYLKLDYAKMLVDIGEINKARPLLALYSAYDPSNQQVSLAIAKIAYEEGRYQEALDSIKRILKKDSANVDATALHDEVVAAKASWLKLTGGYYTDDQPLKKAEPAIEAGVFLCPFSTLLFNVQAPVFFGNNQTYNAQWFQAGDLVTLHKTGLVIGINAGVARLANGKANWSGNIELHETLVRHLVISAQAQRLPYYLTLTSLDSGLMVNNYNASIEWNDMNNWNGKASIMFNQYPDNNYTTSFSAWVFTPSLKVSVFDFHLGYAYGYSAAKESRFVAQNSLAQIIANYDSTTKINGIYDPYFTPKDQQTHSALLNIGIHPAKIVELGASGSIGFYATAQNPYLYLNKDQDGNTVIATGFSPVHFLPASANAFILVHITKKIAIQADYHYLRTYFFTSNYVGLSVKINFWNERG